MKCIRFTETEWHSMAYHKSYAIDESDIEGYFDNIERFYEVLTHQQTEMFADVEPVGDEPTDDEQDAFNEVLSNVGHIDSEDDIYTMRKGGFDITYKDIEMGDNND